MTEKCPICLESLNSDIGVIVPCGHCLHRSCFQALQENHAQNDDASSTSSKPSMPPCPVCKGKSKKFHNIFLTIPSTCPTVYSDVGSENDLECTQQAVASLAGENMQLKESLSNMRSLSHDQSQLLHRMLPKYKELEGKLIRSQKDKRQTELALREIESENSDLITEWNDIEIKMQCIKAEKTDLEQKLQISQKEKFALCGIWNQLDGKLTRANKKREHLKEELKRGHSEQKEFRRMAEMEKKDLKSLLDQSRLQTKTLKREIKKLKQLNKQKKKSKKHVAGASLTSSASILLSKSVCNDLHNFRKRHAVRLDRM